MPYLDYVETHLRIPEIKAFDNDILLLIVPDGAHTHHTPITLETLQTDMAIKLRNLSCRTLKIKKGMKIAHAVASNIVPPLISPQVPENVP